MTSTEGHLALSAAAETEQMPTARYRSYSEVSQGYPQWAWLVDRRGRVIRSIKSEDLRAVFDLGQIDQD